MTSGERTRVAFFTTDDLLGHSGIDRYASDLLCELAKRDDLEVVPVASAPAAAWLREGIPETADPIVTTAGRGPLRSLEERYALGGKLARAGVDVVHGTKHILPRRAHCPMVLTVHDLFPLTRRREYRASKRLFLPAVYRRSLAQADRMIVMTETNRRQLVDRGLADDSKVDVVPAAPSSALTGAKPKALKVLENRPFALCVGDLSPRKNVELLLRIWPGVHRETGITLVLVGPDRTRDQAVRDRFAALEASGVAVRTGGVSDANLRWCYEHARVVLIPSLEAMHFGAPIVTSRDPALVEVSGDSALHLDSSDDEAWERAIVALASKPAERAGTPPEMTWATVAEMTAGVYHRVARGGR